MIRCCSKLFIPVPSHSGSPVCLSRIYVACSNNDFSQRRYASGESHPPRRFRKYFYTTVGVTLVGVGGIVVYAKSDPKFRKVLDSYVPGSDKFISIIYREGGSLNVDFTERLSSVQDKVLSFPRDIYKQISGTSSEESPSGLSKAKILQSEETVKTKLKPAVDTSKKTRVVFEVSANEIKTLGDELTKSYSSIISLIEGGNEIIDLIDKLDDNPDTKAWEDIQKKTEENKKIAEEVDSKLNEAGEKTKKFSNMLKNDKSLSADEVQSMKALESDILKAKEKAENMKKNKLTASENYFNKINDAKKGLSDELAALFPKAKLREKQLRLAEDEIDLFLFYAHQKMLYYQKELAKLENVIAQKLKKAIDSKDDSQLLQAAITARVQEEKRKIKDEYDEKIGKLKSGCDEEVHKQLKQQEQVHMDVLNDQLSLKEKEVERKLIQKMEERLLEEQSKLQAELADMTGRMQGLNEAIAKRALQDQKAQTSQALWSAAEALYEDLKHSNDEDSGKLKPLTEDVEAVKNAAAEGDDLVETVLATIPSVALDRGVYPEDTLRERFLKVEKVAWRVAGVPEGGASLPKLLIAWLQSALVIKASEPIPPGELNNEPFDPSTLNNYDILQRARYWVDRGDFEQALKYMNLLKGGARAIASDWMKEATILLETQQAANLLLAHASASGMIYS